MKLIRTAHQPDHTPTSIDDHAASTSANTPEAHLQPILSRDNKPIPPARLIADLHDGSLPTLEIATIHNIPLPELCRWINSPEVAALLELFAKADTTRARAIASAAAPTAAKALADLTTADRETTRRHAASAILRAARTPTITRETTRKNHNHQAMPALPHQRHTPLPHQDQDHALAPRLRNLLQHTQHTARIPVRRHMDQPKTPLRATHARATTMNMNQKLRALLADIRAADDRLKVLDAWTLAGRLIPRLPVDQAEATRAITERDADAFEKILDQLDAPPPPVTKPDVTFTKGEYESAMAAFKKRLKIIRLNDESKLGGRYTSGGHRSGIDAIEPPTDHHPKIWKALIAEGRLVSAGQGMYALAPGEPRPKE